MSTNEPIVLEMGLEHSEYVSKMKRTFGDPKKIGFEIEYSVDRIRMRAWAFRYGVDVHGGDEMDVQGKYTIWLGHNDDYKGGNKRTLKDYPVRKGKYGLAAIGA